MYMPFDPTGQTDSGAVPDPNDPNNPLNKKVPPSAPGTGNIGMTPPGGPGAAPQGGSPSPTGLFAAGLAGVGQGMAAGNPQSAQMAQNYGQAGGALGRGFHSYMGANRGSGEQPGAQGHGLPGGQSGDFGGETGSPDAFPGVPQPPQPPVAPGSPYDEPAAQGGIFNKPTRVLLGERGPEAVVPLRGQGAGIVSPSAMLPGMGSMPRQPRYEGSHPGEIRTPPPIMPGGRIGNGSLPGPAEPMKGAGVSMPKPAKFNNYKPNRV